MPNTHIDFPILQYFLCTIETMTGLPPQPLDASPEQRIRAEDADKPQTVPKGVVIGPDGKP